MHYAPRTIAIITELFHPPIHPDPAPVQRVHNQLFQTGHSPYQGFVVTPQGPVLSNPTTRPGASSMAAFLADRFQFREEFSSLTVEEFALRARFVTELVAAQTGVQVFTTQQVTVRTLLNPRHFKDSRAFLKQGLLGLEGETEDFGREPQLFGVRMVFPAQESSPHTFSLRIESYHADTRDVYIENMATFPPVLASRGLATVETNILETYRFLVERALRFVSRFDAKLET
ncbi:MAG: hypothetical protein IPK67_06790 [Planctomycetes bacterium]|jgi:hypothetical protein|nr:hypothetical protein [Planctomycetota bacterium]